MICHSCVVYLAHQALASFSESFLDEEVEPALMLLDARRVTVHPRAVQWNEPTRYYQLHLESGELGEYKAIDFVNFAVDMLIQQCPDMSPLTTIEEYRAWLVELITPIEESE